MKNESNKKGKSDINAQSQKVYNELLRKEMLRKLTEKAQSNDETFRKTLKVLINDDGDLKKKLYGR